MMLIAIGVGVGVGVVIGIVLGVPIAVYVLDRIVMHEVVRGRW